ncbi:MAG TPA: 3-deoxy-manno-octulosonate cytidylyltransferase [Tepidisphaeraceae bacterium]|nr:3-deoxy-manno-octulosonate cytidylyltransferase [Tepidisphaeraceae bacterium]
MAATVVIPARFASTRFPGKMIAADTGRPLVQHVVDQVKKCKRVRNVIVATDDHRIVQAVKPFGTIVTMTSQDHQSGTDRIWEVVREWPGELVINVQGDEPEIEPETIDRLVERMESPEGAADDMATAATAFPAGSDPADPNLVKVVTDRDGRALYFSRSPIPCRRDPDNADNAAYYLHLGIYAYRWQFLLDFSHWPQTGLEKTEKLEQLRALEHGRSIYVLKVARATHGIDTPEQYAAFVARCKRVASG